MSTHENEPTAAGAVNEIKDSVDMNVHSTPSSEIPINTCFKIILASLCNNIVKSFKEICQCLIVFSLLFCDTRVTVTLTLMLMAALTLVPNNFPQLLPTKNEGKEDTESETDSDTENHPKKKRKKRKIGIKKSILKIQRTRKAYDELSVPTEREVRLKNQVRRLKEKRKKREYQDNNSSSCSDSEIEIIIPTKPSPFAKSANFSLLGKIGETEVVFQIDTGSSISILNKSIYDKLDESIIYNEKKPRRSYVDFNGNRIEFLCEVDIPCQFDNQLINHTFLVTKSEDASCLIGRDLIRSKRMSIEIEEDCRVFVTFHKTKNMEHKRIGIIENREYEIVVAETTQLDPSSTTAVNVTLDNNQVNFIGHPELSNMIGESCLDLEPFTREKMLSALDKNGEFAVPIVNPNYGPTTLFEGQKIGSFKFLEEGTELYSKQTGAKEIINKDHKIEPSLDNTIKYLEKRFTNPKTCSSEKSDKNQTPPTDGINKIKATNESDENSSVAEESDHAESLMPQRIPDPPHVWKDVLADVPTHLQKRVFNLLTEKHPNIVSKSSVDFGTCVLPDSEFCINLTDDTPISTKPYPLNRVYEGHLDEVINDMISAGLLTAESSNYSSGVFIRQRPDSTNTGNFRIRCISDYRQLNSKTIADLYPLPNIKFILQKLNRKKYFILVDLKDSYQEHE